MKQNTGIATALFNAVLDLIINTGSIYLAVILLEYDIYKFSSNAIIVASICAVVSVLVYFMFDLYSTTVLEKLHKEIGRFAGAQLFNLFGLFVLIMIVAPTKSIYYSLSFFSALFSFGALVIKRIIFTKLAHSHRRLKKRRKTILLVGNGGSALEYKKQIDENPHYGCTVIGCVSDDQSEALEHFGNYDSLAEVIDDIEPDEVVIALSIAEESMIQRFSEICDSKGVRASIVPPIYKYFKAKCQVDMVGSLPVINTRDIPLDNPANAAMKRVMDVLIALLGIALTLPIMLIATIGVRLSSKGPVIFKQKRVGKNNKIFTMYKFRSMRVNDHESTGWTTPYDKRKTRFGTFMRKTGIDELPQLFNVLFGSMSIIGPRPELPAFVEQYSKTVPLYKVKHQVKPGITGLAQIYGFRGDTSIEGRIEMDIKYIENWSMFNDIKILFLTPFKMFNRNEKYVK